MRTQLNLCSRSFQAKQWRNLKKKSKGKRRLDRSSLLFLLSVVFSKSNHLHTTLDELAECFTLEHTVAQEGKVDELVQHLVVFGEV